ncbi:ATP-binding protein [Desulfonatronum thioautotrophicum]|uniref:ATP-binding protein n=1 Tax=Desulfonatronum thioautotrophicum TaxID=617001 RepID=UPI000A077CFA|nr:ATP-binding protein [Desulfonatronum thioautotrophicum]
MSQGVSPLFERLPSIPAPMERLRSFQSQLGIVQEDFARMDHLSPSFLPEKDGFARRVFDHFHTIPATKVVLDHGPSPERMIRIWSHWYEAFFRNRNEEAFLTAQWRSGLNHVAAGIDHRYISLAYAMARKFIHEVAFDKLEPEQCSPAIDLMDRFLDLCLLVETDAFITSLTKCDLEIIRGIAHQVRNPLMVIGGNVLRLRKQVPESDPRQEIYQTMLLEANRLERMVRNVTTYNEVFQREPRTAPCDLEKAVHAALLELKPPENVLVDIRIDSAHPTVLMDPEDLRIILFHLIQNSLENVADASQPRIQIVSGTSENKRSYLEIRIFNNGPSPDPESLESLFTPFYSTKALGTGFGLPIARLAVRKNHGHLTIQSHPEEGATCLITLPT